MATSNWTTTERVAQIVRQCLAEGKTVEIDGLGVFVPDQRRGFRFEASNTPQVFIAYVQEDAPIAARLYTALAKAGFNPWMDRRKLLPGQNWPRAIEAVIETSDFFIACYSTHSVRKRGGFQAEIRYALDCARRAPLDDVYIIPVRLDDCRVPPVVRRELQYIDLFPHWNRGVGRISAIMRRQTAARRRGVV